MTIFTRPQWCIEPLRPQPHAAVRAVSTRLLLLCLLLRSSWLAAEGGRQVGAARVLHRRGGGAGVAVSVGVAGGVPLQQRAVPRAALLHFADAPVCDPASACRRLQASRAWPS